MAQLKYGELNLGDIQQYEPINRPLNPRLFKRRQPLSWMVTENQSELDVIKLDQQGDQYRVTLRVKRPGRIQERISFYSDPDKRKEFARCKVSGQCIASVPPPIAADGNPPPTGKADDARAEAARAEAARAEAARAEAARAEAAKAEAAKAEAAKAEAARAEAARAEAARAEAARAEAARVGAAKAEAARVEAAKAEAARAEAARVGAAKAEAAKVEAKARAELGIILPELANAARRPVSQDKIDAENLAQQLRNTSRLELERTQNTNQDKDTDTRKVGLKERVDALAEERARWMKR